MDFTRISPLKGHKNVKASRTSAKTKGEAKRAGTVQHEAKKAQRDLTNLVKYLIERE